MAQFDESKVINSLHTDKTEVGKKYWYSDNAYRLKIHIEHDSTSFVGKLEDVDLNRSNPFIFKDCDDGWEYIYPYEEPPKQRMTYRQLAEWLAKGNGEYIDSPKQYCLPMCTTSYSEERRNEPVFQSLFIRTWDSEEWIEPTVDIYERDCKRR